MRLCRIFSFWINIYTIDYIYCSGHHTGTAAGTVQYPARGTLVIGYTGTAVVKATIQASGRLTIGYYGFNVGFQLVTQGVAEGTLQGSAAVVFTLASLADATMQGTDAVGALEASQITATLQGSAAPGFIT